MKDKSHSNRVSDEKNECIVFTGSPVEDVNHAKSFWKSLTLHPPLESRLVSADIRQRLRVAAPLATDKVLPSHTREEVKTAVFLHQSYEMVLKDEKDKRLKTVSQREAALNLLHKQRMERLQKEMISLPFKPKKQEFFMPVQSDYITDELE